MKANNKSAMHIQGQRATAKTWSRFFYDGIVGPQRSTSGDLEETNTEEKGELRIVLLGRTGVGKSATGNTILGEEAFESSFSASSVTRECRKECRIINGRKVSVIDTPGLFDTDLSEEEIVREIKKCISFCSPGPHAFLVVFKPERFTKECAKTLELIDEMFSDEARDYIIAVFTHGDVLEQNIKRFIRSNPDLRKFVRSCASRFFLINNKEKDSEQVHKLLDNIDEMVSFNSGEHYTNEMLKKAERAIEERKEQILRENEEQRRREIEKLAVKHQGEELQKMQRQLAEDHERMARTEAEKHNTFIFSLLSIGFAILKLWFSS